MTVRSDLRKVVRTWRRGLSEAEQRHCAERVAQGFASTRLFRCAKHIAFYFPVNGELNPIPLMQRAWAMGKRSYLPVLTGVGSRHLRFSPYYPDDFLAYNRYGILEPQRPVRERVSASRLDLVVLPLVAFDAQGNRLGMGAGYYDRTLAFLLQRQRWHHPHLFGLGYDFQKMAAIDPAPWDVPLDGVVTETSLYLADR